MLGGGSGHIFDMISRYNENMKLLRKNHVFNKNLKFLDSYQEKYVTRHQKISFPQANSEQLSILRKKLKKENKKITILNLCLISVFSLIFLFVTFKMMNAINKSDQKIEKWDHEIQTEKQEVMKNNFNYYLSYGDEWFEKQHWHNAIFQYNKALEIYPEDYQATYKLAIALTNQCKQKRDNCDETKKIINNLIEKHPEKKELYELRIIFNYTISDSSMTFSDLKKIKELENK